MPERRSLSPMKRLAVFERAKGVCHLCEQRIKAGDKWEVEHVRPLGLLGEDEAHNMAPAHVACHAEKTKIDVPAIAKAKRMKARHLGIKKRSSFPKPPPGYRYDWKRRGLVKETAS
jgi:5-methylcytosine-specific restriction protein A